MKYPRTRRALAELTLVTATAWMLAVMPILFLAFVLVWISPSSADRIAVEGAAWSLGAAAGALLILAKDRIASIPTAMALDVAAWALLLVVCVVALSGLAGPIYADMG